MLSKVLKQLAMRAVEYGTCNRNMKGLKQVDESQEVGIWAIEAPCEYNKIKKQKALVFLRNNYIQLVTLIVNIDLSDSELNEVHDDFYMLSEYDITRLAIKTGCDF